MDEIRLSDKMTDVDFEFVYRFLAEDSIWAKGIGRKTQQKALDNSLCISAFLGENQVGFVRAVTDRATFAWIDDLFVSSKTRRMGIASLLFQEVTNHPELASVTSWWTCSSNPDARVLFEKYGFEVPDQQRIGKWMGRPRLITAAYKT